MAIGQERGVADRSAELAGSGAPWRTPIRVASALVPSGEGRVEGCLRRTNAVHAPNEVQCLGCTIEPIHAGVLPFNRDRTRVADVVEHPEDVLPAGVAVTGGDEVPAASRVRPRKMR